MIGLRGEALSAEEREWLLNPLIGGVILFTRNFVSRSQLEDLVADVRSLRTPSLLVSVDQEGGRVQRFRGSFTRLPPMRELGLRYRADPQAIPKRAAQLGWLMAAELRACGIDLSFAPVVDLDRGMASVIGDRALHANADAVAELAVAFMRGMKDAGMVATAKHFPTHAGAVVDSHEALAVDNRDYSELIDDLLPYQRLIDAGLRSVMIAHVVFPALDERPASLSEWWIRDQLRSHLRFNGAVISDDLGMGGVKSEGSMADRAERALRAGCDMVLICNDFETVPSVLQRLEGYSDPAAQLRLVRLRGGKCATWQELMASDQWSSANQLAVSFDARPTLTLEG